MSCHDDAMPLTTMAADTSRYNSNKLLKQNKHLESFFGLKNAEQERKQRRRWRAKGEPSPAFDRFPASAAAVKEKLLRNSIHTFCRCGKRSCLHFCSCRPSPASSPLHSSLSRCSCARAVASSATWASATPAKRNTTPSLLAGDYTPPLPPTQ